MRSASSALDCSAGAALTTSISRWTLTCQLGQPDTVSGRIPVMTTRFLAAAITLVFLLPVQSASGEPSPFDQQVASIQALTLVGSDVLYAGSFGFGLFRSGDRGATWNKSGEGVSDPFILSLATARDGT